MMRQYEKVRDLSSSQYLRGFDDWYTSLLYLEITVSAGTTTQWISKDERSRRLVE